ncbi:MAG: ABC transporter ATP-binding protein [Flavobacteriales bacterium]|jgi:ABC-type polysaccharide/polyol phosphate transport system ATPase subunit|nr:ABC transporter ATP-binding protein [Flavobacteriales bacterium]NCG29191.1 ATP-binding cassette domain-containing protein [Bacteroidota bacterium]MBT3964659.1 ABC transporter ATP-binding protein [Flavobacteriales bacterium]MBT4704220.1 ABC transporter ATP-binding protein [Flavobacteriales bacterium]MBT4929958.1 ABC transporter ATP-binding protein [Flavobacteriales bacterium]
MTAIEAIDLGIQFKLSRFKNTRVKEVLSKVITPQKVVSQKQHFWALRNLNFKVEQGEVLGVIGSNGSGKSTLLRAIGGIYEPDEGSINVNGSASALLSLGTGFKDELSGWENIFLNATILGFTQDEINGNVQDIVEFTELGRFINEPVKTYSSGMKARLGFGIAVHLRREIMLVDEILGVGDFKFRRKSKEKIQDLINDDRTVVLVSHSMESIENYTTKCLWINKGQQMKFGETKEVIEAYLKS